MWNSLSTALMALLLLSEPTTARHHKRAESVCIETTVEFVTVTEDWPPAPSASSGVLLENSDGEAQSSSGPLLEGSNGQVEISAPVVSTLTVVPVPVGTVSGVFYPGLLTGSGSGYAYPTGHHHHHNKSGNHTHSNSSSSIPFFTLSVTSSVPVPTLSTSVLEIPSTSETPTTTSISTSSAAASTSVSSISTPIAPTTTSILITPSTSAAPSPTTAPETSTPVAAPSGTSIPFLRGVNLGGWLVLEKWMASDNIFSGAFANAVDQWTFDSIPGAEAALQTHWSTWFTEEDIKNIAATGINALRIPIGYWAFDNSNTPYIQGAEQFLDLAIGWARTYGLKVWVDCHGSPGSQNGFDNSGHALTSETITWQQTANLQQSISVLKTMAAKYGALEYADVVVGLELVNEPISWGNNVFSVTQSWAQEAYAAVKSQVANENLVIVMHDAFQGPLAWTSIAQGLLSDVQGAKTFGVDTHLYQVFSDSDNALTQAQHITEACGWAANLATANLVMPTYVGEWSPATNICVNPDGSTTAGTSCSVSGCQCQSADFSTWNSGMVEQVRRFVEAQLDVFEGSTSGYFMWAAKGPGGWGFLNGIENGAIPNPVTSRQYPGQCGNSKRREKRGLLGAAAEAF